MQVFMCTHVHVIVKTIPFNSISVLSRVRYMYMYMDMI